MFMSRLIAFLLIASNCKSREECENYKMKFIDHSGTRTHFLSLTRMAL